MRKHCPVLIPPPVFFLPQPSPQQAFFAIFDGHGGTEAAIYSAAHLLCNTVRHEAFSVNPAKAFMKGFPATDEDFLLRAKEEVSQFFFMHVLYYFPAIKHLNLNLFWWFCGKLWYLLSIKHNPLIPGGITWCYRHCVCWCPDAIALGLWYP